MSTDILPFDFEGQTVRTAHMEDGSPAIVLSDIAKMLGYRSASDAGRLLRDHHKGYAKVRTLGGDQQMVVVNERGFNRLVIRSNASNAERVQDWITDEVMPTISKTGSYGQVQQLTGPELMAAALIEADSVIKSHTLQIEAADKYISELTPKAEYVDLYVTDQDLRTLREVAKNLGAQETEVRTALLERRWIYCETASRWSEKEGRKVTQRRYSPMADKRDYFRTIPRHEAPRFKDGIDHTLKVTPAGARAIGMALVRWGIIPSPLTDVAMEVA